jgi:uncharacterized protein YutE (UPF0331/DUF86 family)
MAPVDRGKLRSHLDHVRGNLRRLRELQSDGRDGFLGDEVVQAAATRWLQTSIEAMIDIANHIIAREALGVPRSYAETIEILVSEGVLPKEHRERFLTMVRFRNRVVHLYDHVDAEEIWRVLAHDLGDFDLFITAIVTRYFTS